MANKQNDTERIYSIIKERIAAFEYKPGMYFKEKELSEEFGTSRTPIRDAITRLVAEGLVKVIPSRGTYVNKNSFKELIDVYEVRNHLMELAGNLAAKRISKNDIEKMKELLAELEKEEDTDRIIQIDSKFHEIINASMKNEELARILNNLKIKYLSIWEYPIEEDYFDNIRDDFRDLIEALEEKDEEKSGEILKNHVQRIMNYIKDKLI